MGKGTLAVVLVLVLVGIACRAPSVSPPEATPAPTPAPSPEATAVPEATMPAPVAEATPTPAPSSPAPSRPAEATPPPTARPTLPEPTRPPTPPPTEAEIVARLKETVVRLVTPVGQGSGVIIDPRGFVLTANHVVSGSPQVTVVFGDGRRERGLILGRDEFRDLAVVKISGREDLLAAPMGDSALLFPSDRVLAMGYTGNTLVVTEGILSERLVQGGLTFLQTDALLIPGFSGGPLFTPKGEVIGMSVQLLPGASGGGLAVALDSVQSVIPRLMSGELFLAELSPQPGASRENPAPVGAPVVVWGFSVFGDPTLHEMTVLEVFRGEAATAKLLEVNRFNPPPLPGWDYVVVKMRVNYLRGPLDQTVRVSWIYFDLFASQGYAYSPAFEVLPPQPLLAHDLLPGSTVEAWLVWGARAEDASPVIAYGIDWGSRGVAWFSITPAGAAPEATPPSTAGPGSPAPDYTPTP